MKWVAQNLSGNPVHSSLVDKYIDTMEKAQTRAGVVVNQAPMLSPLHFTILMQHLSTLANDASTPPWRRLQIFMDACAFSFQYAAGSRMGDLLTSLRTTDVRLSPLSVGFRQQWGKTVRGYGRRRDFDLPVREQLVCPARRFCEYVLAARSLGIDLTRNSAADPSGSPIGFLFRRIDADGVRPTPETYNRLQARFRTYLVDLGIYAGHTLHGIRAAHSVEAALRGIAPASVAEFVGWASEAMPQHYSRMQRTMGTLLPLLPTTSCATVEYAARMASEQSRCIPLHIYEMVAQESHFLPINLDI